MSHSPKNTPTSITLLNKIGKFPRDEASWKRFEKIYSPLISCYFRKRGLQESDVLDLKQMVFSKFIQQATSFQYNESKSFKGYLLKIIHTVFADWIEKKKHQEGLIQSGQFLTITEIPTDESSTHNLEMEFDLELYDQAKNQVQNTVEQRTWQAFECLAIKGMTGEEAEVYLNMKRGSIFAAKCKVQRLIRIEVEKRLAEMDYS